LTDVDACEPVDAIPVEVMPVELDDAAGAVPTH